MSDEKLQELVDALLNHFVQTNKDEHDKLLLAAFYGLPCKVHLKWDDEKEEVVMKVLEPK